MPILLKPNLVCTLAIALAVTLSGCEKKKPRLSASHPLPQQPLVANCEPGRIGGELHLTLNGTPKNFNPLTSDATSQEVTRLLFASLTSMDWQTQEIRPALAESWMVAPDAKTWTFKLRQGLRWSDGYPLTADDVVFTWNNVIYAHKAPAYLAEVFNIGGTNFSVSKVDDVTIQVVTPDVFPPLVEFFGNVPILPKHVFDRAAEESRTATAQNTATPFEQIACSGPFRPKKLNTGSSVILERNPEYWVVDKAGQRLPYFDYVIFTITGKPSQLFLDGQSDAQERVGLDEYATYQKAASGGKIQLLNAGLVAEKDILWFNQNTGHDPLTGKPIVDPIRLKWFRDQKFRQAVALAIDREQITRTVYGGRAEPSYGFIGSENKNWSNPNIPRHPFNPTKAQELLTAIGLQDRNHDGVLEDADGHAVEIPFLTNLGNATRTATARLIAESLAKVGIKLDLQPLPFAELAEKVNESQDYECVLLGLGGGGIDPTASINALLSANPGCQWFPSQTSPSTEWEAHIDTLMQAQSRTLNLAERKKVFNDVQTILAEQLPMIYIVSPFAYAAVAKHIGNARPSALTPYRATWNTEELYRK